MTESTIPTKYKGITIVRVPNGWAIYPDSGVYAMERACVNLPIAVARTVREVSGYVQSWAECAEAESAK